jgi:hypothetical protein
MTKDNLFDDIARVLASPMPRRQAFRVIAGGLASGAVISLLEPKRAHAGAILSCDTADACGVNHPITNICSLFEDTCDPGPKKDCSCQPILKTTACVCTKCPKNNKGQITAIRSGPPTQADVTMQNAVEGISTIAVAKAVNCTVANMPMDAGGTKSPVVCTATKIDQTKPAQIVFNTGPLHGGSCPIDPIFTVLKLTTGRWARQTFADVPKAEHFITVTNGDPGLNRLHIWVNSKHFNTLSLGDNETRSLDLAAAKMEKTNTISLVGAGELGASASVLIGDIPQAPAAKKGGVGATAVAPAQGSSPRHNPVWGPLAEETEENSHLHAANAASQTVRINFNGALNSGAASNSSAFTVEVNAEPAAVQAAHVQAGAAGMDLTLQLPRGTLHKGDNVDVYWENLQDAKGRPLSGHVPLFAQ